MRNPTGALSHWKLVAMALLATALLMSVACGSDEEPTPTATSEEQATAIPTEQPSGDEQPTATPTEEADGEDEPTATPTEQPSGDEEPTATPVVATPTVTQAAGEPVEQSGTLSVAVPSVGTPIFLNRDAIFPDNMLHYNYGILETLAQWDGETCTGPMLARSWDVAPDQSYVDFQLEEGVHFRSADRDWGEMTAEDVAYSFNDAASSESTHSAQGEMSETFSNWEAMDTYTVRATFNTYRGDFITFNTVSMCNDSVAVLSKAVYDEMGEDARDTMVGTGPLVVKEWRPDERIVAEAVQDHWRMTPGYAEARLIQASEGSVRAAMLKTGEADIAPVPVPEVPDLQSEGVGFNDDLNQFNGLIVYFAGNFWFQEDPETGEPVQREGFTPDDEHPWIGDPQDPDRMESARKVRQAMAMAIDRDAITETLLAGYGGPIYMGAYGVHPDSPEWKDRWEIDFDPEGAKALLDEAGYGDGFNMELYCPVDIGVTQEVCLAVAGMWQDNLGLNVELNTAAYTSRRPSMVGRQINTVWIAPWGPNRVTARQDPGGTTSRGWPDQGYNAGIEAPSFYEYYQTTAAQEQASDENYATREEYFDWTVEERLSTGVVEVPSLVGFDPDRVMSWDLKPYRNINSFETVQIAN